MNCVCETPPLSDPLLDRLAAIAAAAETFASYGLTAAKARALFEAASVDPRQKIWVAYSDASRAPSACVGFALTIQQGAFHRSPYLRLIAVDSEQKRAGVGRCLMQTVEADLLRPFGLFLLTTSTNRIARQFYERLGYRCVGEIPDYVVPGKTEALYFKSGA